MLNLDKWFIPNKTKSTKFYIRLKTLNSDYSILINTKPLQPTPISNIK